MVTKSLHEELKTKGILVAALHPGWVRTGIGGPEATLSTEESIKDCLNVLSKLSNENSGCLLSYNGEKIEWWPDLFDCILRSFCNFDWYIFRDLKKGLASTFNEKAKSRKNNKSLCFIYNPNSIYHMWQSLHNLMDAQKYDALPTIIFSSGSTLPDKPDWSVSLLVIELLTE